MELQNIDWKFAITVVLGLLSTGGLIGYWIRSKIELHQKEKEWKNKYYFEDLKKQRELLLEFLGTILSEFKTLHNVGHTYNEGWRRKWAEVINKWVEKHRPVFPVEIRRELTYISKVAGAMVKDNSIEYTQRLEIFEEIDKRIENIESYIEKIGKELKGK